MMRIMNVEQVGRLVRQARKAQGFTQAKLAQFCLVGGRFLSDLENAKPTCEIGKVLHILFNLGIKIEVNDFSCITSFLPEAQQPAALAALQEGMAKTSGSTKRHHKRHKMRKKIRRLKNGQLKKIE